MGKAPQPRKESATFRLEPQLKYTAELASRIQRRNLTNYVEWALEQSFNSVWLADGSTTLNQVVNDLWDVDEVDRFLKLAFSYPEYLTYEEQEMFKIITDNFNYFKKEPAQLSDTKMANWLKIIRSYDDLSEIAKEYNRPISYFFCFKAIKDNWEDIKALTPINKWFALPRNGIDPTDPPF